MGKVGVSYNTIDKLDPTVTLAGSDIIVVSQGAPEIPERSANLTDLTAFIAANLKITLTENQIAFGDASNELTSSADITWDGAAFGVNGQIVPPINIAIGNTVVSGQASNAIAIGTGAGFLNQAANGIIISSTGVAENETSVGHIVVKSSLASMVYTSATDKFVFDKFLVSDTDKLVETLPDNVIEIWQMSDFDATASEIAGVRTFTISTEYRIKRDLTTSDRFVIPSGIEIIFRGIEALREFTYTGTGTFITATDSLGLGLIAMRMFSTSTGTFCSFTNAGGAQLSRLFVKLGGFFNWDSMGTMTASRMFVLEGGFTNCGGITLTDSLDTRFNVFNWRNTVDTGTDFITIDGTNLNFATFINGVFDKQAGESVFNISSSFATTSLIRIADNTFIGAGPIFNAASLDETDTRVISSRNAGLRNSNTIGSFTFNANASDTVITDGAYVAMTLTNVVAGSNIERFSLTSAANGVLTYDDTRDFEGTLTATIATESAPAEANYRIAVSINGVVPTFATAIYMPLTVKDQGQSVALVLPDSLVSGDTVQLMIAGDGTSTNVALAHGQIAIQ